MPQSALSNHRMLLNSLFWACFADLKASHLPWRHTCGRYDSADAAAPPSAPGFPQSSHRLVEKEEASAGAHKADVSVLHSVTVNENQQPQDEQEDGGAVGRRLGRVRFLSRRLSRRLSLERHKRNLKGAERCRSPFPPMQRGSDSSSVFFWKPSCYGLRTSLLMSSCSPLIDWLDSLT